MIRVEVKRSRAEEIFDFTFTFNLNTLSSSAISLLFLFFKGGLCGESFVDEILLFLEILSFRKSSNFVWIFLFLVVLRF